MSDWNDLARELDAWAAEGRTATLWWRDDDAVADTPALARLRELASRQRVPVALAVVPASLQASLAAFDGAIVVQHGYAHRNHAPAGAKACELGGARAAADAVADLVRGRDALARRFGSGFLPVLVPPWNRIAADVVARLRDAGFAALSTFGPRASPHAAPGLAQCNAHVDPIGWRTGRGFVGAAACLAALVDHLAARRAGRADAAEPTGYLTHHLVFDDAAWGFTGALFARTRAHRAVRWLDAKDAFTCGRRA